jgi:hypothetical protein
MLEQVRILYVSNLYLKQNMENEYYFKFYANLRI